MTACFRSWRRLQFDSSQLLDVQQHWVQMRNKSSALLVGRKPWRETALSLVNSVNLLEHDGDSQECTTLLAPERINSAQTATGLVLVVADRSESSLANCDYPACVLDQAERFASDHRILDALASSTSRIKLEGDDTWRNTIRGGFQSVRFEILDCADILRSSNLDAHDVVFVEWCDEIRSSQAARAALRHSHKSIYVFPPLPQAEPDETYRDQVEIYRSEVKEEKCELLVTTPLERTTSGLLLLILAVSRSARQIRAEFNNCVAHVLNDWKSLTTIADSKHHVETLKDCLQRLLRVQFPGTLETRSVSLASSVQDVADTHHFAASDSRILKLSDTRQVTVDEPDVELAVNEGALVAILILLHAASEGEQLRYSVRETSDAAVAQIAATFYFRSHVDFIGTPQYFALGDFLRSIQGSLDEVSLNGVKFSLPR